MAPNGRPVKTHNRRQLQAYARASGLLFSEKESLANEKLRQIQGEYSKTQVDRAEKQAKYETAITKPIESLPEIPDDSTLREYGLKLSVLRQEKAQLTSVLFVLGTAGLLSVLEKERR